ncbi:hypothetical protein MMC25_008195 [Agyrium rufum]|nr:hypothetical protein [Agyrium rufum]
MLHLKGGFRRSQLTNPSTDPGFEGLSDEVMDDNGSLESDELENDGISEAGDMEEDIQSDDNEDYDENEEWPWITGLHTDRKRQIDGKDERIAVCHGRLIDPDLIRHNFYREMEEPSQDLADLAYTLFDRWGCLKQDLQKHPMKRGSGAWGEELHRDVHWLAFETISVDEAFRHQEIAKGMVEELWSKAIASDPKCKFALAWATELPTRQSSDRREGLGVMERAKDVEKNQTAVESFLRAIGFRRVGSSDWFCLAKDPAHPSRGIPTEQDYNLPELRMSPEAVEFHEAISEMNDDACTDLMVARTQERDPSQDPIWTMLGLENSNILHVAFKPDESIFAGMAQRHSQFSPVPKNKMTKTKTLMWLLSQPFTESLLSIVNRRGETPLEAYRSYLEEQRVSTEAGLMKVHVSDHFQGYTADEVNCLLKLQGRTVDYHEISRTRFGCTCGTCEEGFLSPRLLFAMECLADYIGDSVELELEEPGNGANWVEQLEVLWLKYIEPSVLQNLTTNKSMRKGVASTFHHVATCCRNKLVPNTSNVLEVLQNSNEWPPNTRNFLERGGAVASVVQAVFDSVEAGDKYLGSGDHDKLFEQEIVALRPCLNDREIVFACQQYARLEHGST